MYAETNQIAMSNNPKNLLQEHFQSEGLPLPTYDSGRHGGADHKPLWSSQVTLHDGSIFMADRAYSNRKAAEKAADQGGPVRLPG